jgi:hypothetical protein
MSRIRLERSFSNVSSDNLNQNDTNTSNKEIDGDDINPDTGNNNRVWGVTRFFGSPKKSSENTSSYDRI